jgi:uncharacterized protein YndB with AHSA1/START domain
MEPIRIEFSVACSPQHAFDVWATKTALWWPRDHTVSADPDAAVEFEPRPGGRIFERASDGMEHEWGQVLAWEPPRRLAYLWHIAADRSDATEVEVTFTPAHAETNVTIVHRGWERLGARSIDRRERNRTGWAGLIPHYARACLELPS